MSRLLQRIAWCVLAVFAVVNGVLALRYLLPHVPNAPPLPNLQIHRIALAIHASCSAIALILGPFQLVNGFRVRWRLWHRRVGWVYCAAVIVGGIAAFPLSWRASFGPIAGAGFMTLAVLWLWTTGVGVRHAVQHRFEQHRRWMLRSYALTAAAITLRIYLPLSQILGLPFGPSYRTIAWICWVFNLIAIEVYLRLRPASSMRRSQLLTD